MMKKPKAVIVILGSTGDLAKKKLLPALSSIFEKGHINEESVIIGSGRNKITDSDFRDRFEVCCSFKNKLFYYQGIKGLKKYIDEKGNFSKIVFFLALPPGVYLPMLQDIYNEDIEGDISIVIEKPFGNNLESSIKLNSEIHKLFDEKQIFRIDHYLAKEPVQNILAFRFANDLFEPLWNNKYIESIQISASEYFGIDGRGQYFDKAGILRDMVQNHLFQLLCLVTMDTPASLSPEDIETQKRAVLKDLNVLEVKRFQCDEYTVDKQVPDNSGTETFAEIRLNLNNQRWTGIPILIRSGKYLHRNGIEIGIRLKKKSSSLLFDNKDVKANTIIFQVQPSKGIIVNLASKIP